jgi:hypothetical protein
VEDARTQIKYQRLTQTGFETGWHVAPWGSTSWLTVENDDAHPPTFEEFFRKDDRALRYCLFISKLRMTHRELRRAGTVETPSRKCRDSPLSQGRHDNYTTGSIPQVRECYRYFLYLGLFMERETLNIHIRLAREQRLYHYPKLLNYQNELRLTVEKWLSRITFSFVPRHVRLNQLRFDKKPPF